MSKLRTKDHLFELLDKEIAWRLKEISTLRVSIERAKKPFVYTLLRAGVPLLYAHWEGFIKNSATAYIHFVINQKFPLNRLSLNFVAFGAKQFLDNLSQSRRASLHIAAAIFFCNELDAAPKISSGYSVKTQSNLKSSTFDDIALMIGLDTAKYKTRYNLIDKELLNRRNKIAHGEYLDLGSSEFNDLSSEVHQLLRDFKTDIENAVLLNAYLK